MTWRIHAQTKVLSLGIAEQWVCGKVPIRPILISYFPSPISTVITVEIAAGEKHVSSSARRYSKSSNSVCYKNIPQPQTSAIETLNPTPTIVHTDLIRHQCTVSQFQGCARTEDSTSAIDRSRIPHKGAAVDSR
ncbi:MAG: hypothetical protein FJY85_14180 [Deltaproteobacteria bacterium]|nr:hypothetical protein [Deltaproteobacteria bacterium]